MRLEPTVEGVGGHDVAEEGAEIVPSPDGHLPVGEVGLPELVQRVVLSRTARPIVNRASVKRKRRLRPTAFQLVDLKFQGRRSSIAEWG